MTWPRWAGPSVGAIVLLAVLGTAILLLVGRCGGTPQTPPRDTPPVREAPEAEVNEDRPSGENTAPVIGKQPQVVVRTVTVTAPDTALARRYADAQRRTAQWKRERDSLLRLVGTRADSDSVSRETPPPRALLPPVAGSYDGDSLRLWLSQSDGRVMRATARVRPRFTFRAGQGDFTDTLPHVSADPWLVRTARETVDCAPTGAVLALLGALVDEKSLRGAALGLTAGTLSCVIGD